MSKERMQTDVCIVGAGPAGAITALFLARKGIPCILVDREAFPRDKICGDGLSGWVVSVLATLDERLLLRLNSQPFVLPSYGMRVSSPNGRTLDLPFLDTHRLSPEVPPGYICKRIDFDNFLIGEVREKESVSFLEKTVITGFRAAQEGALLTASDGREIAAKLVVFANGASSAFMKDPGGIAKGRKHTMTGIKAYFKGITGMHEKNYVELHFLKGLLPGYLWIFPLPGGEANVGAGLDQETISRKRVNLKKVLTESIRREPHLRERFLAAEQVTPFEAHPLPLWDGRRRISGERFMLAGDAASLVDPVTGEGMGHAAISGMFAALQAERALAAGNFTAAFMEQYDRDVYEKIGKELLISSKVTRFIRHAWLFDAMAGRIAGSRTLREKLTRAMTDLEERKKLKDPWTYVKVLMGL